MVKKGMQEPTGLKRRNKRLETQKKGGTKEWGGLSNPGGKKKGKGQQKASQFENALTQGGGRSHKRKHTLAGIQSVPVKTKEKRLVQYIRPIEKAREGAVVNGGTRKRKRGRGQGKERKTVVLV